MDGVSASLNRARPTHYYLVKLFLFIVPDGAGWQLEIGGGEHSFAAANLSLLPTVLTLIYV